MVLDDAIISFVAGSIKRERQRIANHLRILDVDERIVKGILDGSEDASVFREDGPAVGLEDQPPRGVRARAAR